MLSDYFQNNPGRLMCKWDHYLDIYERHLQRFRGQEVHIVEFGVFHGGSLQMWKEFFGERAHIYGVDREGACKTLEEDRVRIFTGDQGDRSFLRSLKESIPRIDGLIDDGGHSMDQQIGTFEELFAHMSDDGVYICEDLHTSYWEKFGGGLCKSGTFIEYAKRLIDQLNAWHTRDPENFDVDDFTLSTHSMHFYDSMLVVERRRMSPPVWRETGKPSF